MAVGLLVEEDASERVSERDHESVLRNMVDEESYSMRSNLEIRIWVTGKGGSPISVEFSPVEARD